VHTSSDVLEGYRGVFSNKSALACLIGHAFGASVWVISLSLSFSFFREVFSLSRANVVYLTYGTSLSYLIGVIMSRRIIPRFGRKRSAMGSLVLVGLFSLVYFTGFDFVVSLVDCFLVCIFGGIYSSASQGLNLEQLPSQRGSVMSLVSAFGSVGNVLGLSVGGLLLVWYGWSMLGGLGMLFSVIGFTVLSLYAMEPE